MEEKKAAASAVKEANTVVLPLQPVKAKFKSPKNLIIFSKPKTGKTEAISKLEDLLLLDFEGGSDYVDAQKIKVTSINHLFQIAKAVKEADFPYKYVAVDTVTALEAMCIGYAEKLYASRPMGKTWLKKDAKGNLAKDSGKKQYGNILNLPNGSGYGYLREAVTSVIKIIEKMAPRIIILGHIKSILLEKKGTEFTSSDLDLTGKIKSILTSQSDAIGYLHRKGNKNILSFKTSDTVACGARPAHLSNAEITLSEKTDEGLITNWDQIYID